MREGVRQYSPEPKQSIPVVDIEDSVIEIENEKEPHHVSWAEERDAKVEARKEEREYQENLRTIELAIRNGDYELMQVPASLSRKKEFAVDEKSKTQFTKNLALYIDGMRQVGKSNMRVFEDESFSALPKDLELNKNVVDALIERENAGLSVKWYFTRGKRLPTGTHETPSVTVAGKNYTFTKDDLVGSGGFGAVYTGYPAITAEGTQFVWDDTGAIISEKFDLKDDDLNPPLVKVIMQDHPTWEDRRRHEELIAGEIAALDFNGSLVGAKRYVDKMLNEATVVVMERAEGKNMYEMSQEHGDNFANTAGRTALAEGMLAACKDLQRLHVEGVAHRDIKPSNIMFPIENPSHTRLVDYGLVKRVGEKGKDVIEKNERGAVEGTLLYMTYGAMLTEEGAYLDNDVAAIGKSFGGLFDGKSFLSLNRLQMFSSLTGVKDGTLFKAPDFRKPSKKREYLSRLEFDQERAFAELLYDIVLPHDSGEERERKRLNGQLLNITDVIERLEVILNELKILARAKMVVNTFSHGETGNSVTQEQVQEILDSLNWTPDIEKLSGLLEDIGSFHQQKRTPRSDRVPVLRRILKGVTAQVDLWSTKYKRFYASSADTPFIEHIEGIVESARVGLINGDLDLVADLEDEIDFKIDAVKSYSIFLEEFEDHKDKGSSEEEEAFKAKLAKRMLENIISGTAEEVESEHYAIEKEMENWQEHFKAHSALMTESNRRIKAVKEMNLPQDTMPIVVVPGRLRKRVAGE